MSALVLCQPESISYAAGAFPGVATFWRRAGAAFLIVPADETRPLTAIVGDLQAKTFAAQSGIADIRTHRIWVETGRHPFTDDGAHRRSPRPSQFDVVESFALLRDALIGIGLSGKRIGLELGFVPVSDFEHFRQLPFDWADCTRIVERLRAIKSPDEIRKLRHAADFARDGFVILLDQISEGMDAHRMTEIWKEAVKDAASKRGHPLLQSSWAYIAVGGDGFAPGGPAQRGDLIKIDVGCVIDGYSSDGARTVVIGEPSPEAQRVYDSLHRAFEAGLTHFRPGTPLRDVYRSVATAMWDQGFETYNRGHFGHGVGSSIWSEEWPFIANDSDAILEPGMVLAFETPWYIEGLGGFIIEDQLLITESGFEVIAPLPRHLFKL